MAKSMDRVVALPVYVASNAADRVADAAARFGAACRTLYISSIMFSEESLGVICMKG